MNREQVQKLARWMRDDNTPKSSRQCADYLEISAESFRKEIPDIRKQLKKAGAEIISRSGRGNGYVLHIEDEAAFDRYLEQETSAADHALNFQYKVHRVIYITKILLESEGPIKAAKFQDALNISSSQFNKDLQRVKSILQTYHLELQHRPYYGIKVEGNEFDIRSCMSYIFNKERESIEISKNGEYYELMVMLREILIHCCRKADYALSTLTMNNLIVHLLVTIKRAGIDQPIELSEELREELREDPQYALAEMITDRIQEECGMCLSEDEIYYVTMHLSGKRILKEDIDNMNNTAIHLVDRMLDRMMDVYGIDLHSDLNFQMMLATHVTPLIDRVRYNTRLSNPILQEIKTRFLVSYELALCCAEIFEQVYHTWLSEDEIGYIALHIQLALDQQKNVPKKRVLLVCATGRGSAELLKYHFSRKYADSIEQITTCDALQVSGLNLSLYDAIFTTVPLRDEDVSIKIPVFLINEIGESKEKTDIEKFLLSEDDRMNIRESFPRELFFGVVDASDKEEAISLLCRKIGEVYPLPEGFQDSVLLRESMADTSFGGAVAFPHPARILTEKTFVSVAVLRRPIQWGREKVQVILLSSFSKGFVKNSRKVFELITELISDRKYAQLLTENPTPGTFDRICEMILQKGKG